MALGVGSRRGWDQVAIPAEEILARLRIEKKEYTQARADYNQLLSIDAGNYEAHYNLAWLAASDKRLDEGVRHLLEAVADQAKRRRGAQRAYGGLYLRLGNLRESQIGARSGGPPRFQSRLGRITTWGWCCGKQGDAAGAATQFQNALDRRAGFGPAQEAARRS